MDIGFILNKTHQNKMVKPSSEHWTVKKMHLNSLLQKNNLIISLPSYNISLNMWVLLYNDEFFFTLLLNLEDDLVMSDDWWPTFLCLTESWTEWHTSIPHTLHIALLMLLHSFHQRSKIVKFHFFFEHFFLSLYIFFKKKYVNI